MKRSLRFRISRSAAKKINKVDPRLRRRFLEKLQEYENKPELLVSDLKRLSDTRDPVLYRIRIGDYRIVGSIEGAFFNVLDVIHRSEL